MRKRAENPVVDSHSYTFVSLQTLQNTFPENLAARAAVSDLERNAEPDPNFTGAEFTKAPKRVSRKTSEPASKRSRTLA